MSDEVFTIDQDLDKPIYGTGEHYEPVPLTPEDDRIVEGVLRDIVERTTVHEIRGAEVEIYHLAGTDDDHDQSSHGRGGESKGKFFSPLSRALGSAKQNTAPASNWAAIISKAQGVTKDELTATGILGYLQSKGSAQVTKAELEKFASDNAVEIVPVVLGGAVNLEEWRALGERGRELSHEWMKNSDRMREIAPSGLPQGDTSKDSDEYRTLYARNLEINRLEQENTAAIQALNKPTKFEQYTLPGAENYREVLLTLPVKGDALPPGFSAIEKDGTWGVKFPDGTELMGWSSREAAIQSQAKQAGNPAFQSGHFEQPNVVAHLRMDDRADADGNKVLFIEEIQSDWAQAGRKDGFKGEFPQDVLEAAIAGGLPKDQAIADINHLLVEPLDTDERRTVAQWTALTNAVEKGGMNSTRLNEVFHDRRDQGVPLAPFVTDTQAWVGLAMKHAMTEAADGGYNAVAWTTGAQQAERYSLRKQVDELEYIPSVNRLIGWKDRHSAVSETVTPDKLGDYIGKELAQRLLATPLNASSRHVLSGANLEFGGEGMKSFYDKLVPTVAGKLIRKNDPEAKVGAIRLLFERLDKTGTWNDATEQQGFYITPKMRERLRQGVSLFEDDREYHGDHDQSTHGNWARGGERAERPESYFNGWPASSREVVELGDQIAKAYNEPHLIDKVGQALPERQVENLLVSRSKTEAAAVMRDGKLEHFWNGAESLVKIPDAADLTGATLIHNHPSSASLSDGDVIAASVDKLAEVRAVSRFDGATYSFSVRPDTAWPPKEAIRRAYQKNRDRLLTAFAAKRQEKRYTKEQLNFAASHAIMKATLRDLGLKYEVKRWT